MRLYEIIFVLSHEMSAVDASSTVNSYVNVVTESGGSVVHREDWGVRQLAFPIKTGKKGKRGNRGHYVLVRIKSGPLAIAEMRDKFRMSRENILRFEVVLSKDDSANPSPMMQVAPDLHQSAVVQI